MRTHSKKTYHPLIPRSEPSLLSIIVPIYNEQEGLSFLRNELTSFADQLPYPVEFILVNDGSSDLSLEAMLQWSAEDERMKFISLARNFGHQIAVTAGLDHAQGDAIVVIDADLQDPLDVIPKMVQHYTEGYDVVYGQRISRLGESWFKKITAYCFYRLMRWLIHKNLPVDTGDFRLISKTFLTQLRTMREQHRFLRGMGTWLGFPQIGVPFVRQKRLHGETKYPLHKMLSFAWNAALSFSSFPLKLVIIEGCLVAAFGFLLGVYAISRYVIHSFFQPENFIYNPGWASTISAICFTAGSILIGLGIVGEYIGKIYEELKQRPLYVVRMQRNIEEEQSMSMLFEKAS